MKVSKNLLPKIGVIKILIRKSYALYKGFNLWALFKVSKTFITKIRVIDILITNSSYVFSL
jgi:hypothetical protein